MAFKPDGTWEPEDDLVSPRLSGLLAQDSPLMQQAATAGKQYANKRGLMNSSIGAQASQQAAISAALPIASQEAAQIAQKNLSSMSIGSQEKMQQADIAAQLERLNTQISGQKEMQASELAATKERLELELGSRDRLQAAEAAAEKERLGMQLTSQEQLALADLNAAKERLGMQLDSQETIAGMNIASNDREKAAALTAATNNAYLDAWKSIASNTDIPAAARDQFFTHLQQVFNSQMGLLEQLYGIDLVWAGQPATP